MRQRTPEVRRFRTKLVHLFFRIICEWQYYVSPRVGLRCRRCFAKGSLYVGVGIGWHDAVNHPNYCELDNQGTFFIMDFGGHRA